jgi:Family of unknown function (DUF6152)
VGEPARLYRYIELETRDDAGGPTRWMIEGGPPNLIARAGWSAHSLSAGEIVTAAIHPLRNGARGVALGNSITKDDGTILPIRTAALPAALSTPDRPTPAGMMPSACSSWVGAESSQPTATHGRSEAGTQARGSYY